MSDERRLEKIENQIEALRGDVQDIKLAVARIEATQCPAPGTCINNSTRLERLERGLTGLVLTALCGAVAFIFNSFKS